MTAAQQLVTDNLEVWASAIRRRSTAGRGTSKKLELYGVQKLRELILELAVRGLLVQQDPADEPASELLTKIAAEKAKLVKEGKIKKAKPLPAIGDEEKPFKLPNSWDWCRLGTIGNIFNGTSVNASIKENSYTNIEGRPFIATKDVGYGFEALDYENGVCIPLDETGFKIAKQGAVLICAEGGSAGKKCGIADRDICFGNKLFANELFGSIDPKFILSSYLTPTFFIQFSSSMTGIIGGISSAKFSELIVPIAPAQEQLRVVIKIDELMALCDQLEQQTEVSLSAHGTLVEALLAALTNAADHEQFGDAWQRIAAHFDTLFTTDQSINQLKQAILQLAVMGKLVPQDPGDEPAGELLKRIAAERAKFVKESKTNKDSPLPQIEDKDAPFTLPTGWQWARLGTIASLRGGFAYQSSHFVSTGEHQVIRMGNVRPDFLRLEENPVYISKQNADSTKDYEILDGDILLTMTGTKGKNDYLYSALVNKANIDSRRLYLNQRLCSIRLPLFSRNFANVALKDSRLLNAIYKTSTGSANQANVGMGAISSWLIPVPPIDEQHRIVAKVGELMALCNQLNARLNEAQTTQVHLADAMTEQALAV